MKNNFRFVILLVLLALSREVLAEGQKQTTLREMTPPKGTFVRDNFGVMVVNRVEVEIKNVGEYAAEDIHVGAVLPDGQKVDMGGPKTLDRNKSAKYVYSGEEMVKSKKEITVKASCANCRK